MSASKALVAKFEEAELTAEYFAVGLLLQTLVFGAYSLLVFLSTRMLLARGLKTRVNRVMFALTTGMYILTLLYWIYSVDDLMDRLHTFKLQAIDPSFTPPPHSAVTMWSPLFNALTLINYVISDGVVVWRAWIICQRSHRKFLWITIGFLFITVATVVLTIAFRIVLTIISPINNVPTSSGLGRGIDILQVLTIFASFASNVSATGAVSATAWRHSKIIRAALSSSKTRSRRTNRILLLVVETGLLFSISAFINLVSSVVRLPLGTLGDLWTPIQIQIAGAYPSIVLLLVSTERSLSDSTFGGDSFDTEDSSNSTTAPMPPIQFASNGARKTPNNETTFSMSFAPNLNTSRLSSASSMTASPVIEEEEKDEKPPSLEAGQKIEIQALPTSIRPLPRPPPHAAFESMV